jgi:hypothetical protein
MNADHTRDRIRAVMPWWAKGALKLSLSRIPIKYHVRHRLMLAHHGAMTQPAYAHTVFRRHFDSVSFHRKEAGGFTAMELGPGDSLFSAMIAKAYGASASCLVDVGRFASENVELYRSMARHLTEQSLPAPDLSAARTIDNVCAACSATYEINGLESLRRLPSGSMDFIFSNAVLQAVRRDEFLDTLKELRRLTHPQGCNVHSIDLRDMMGMSLNHLRFSPRMWESNLIRESGFYTNRLRLAEIIQLSGEAGFESEVSERNHWPALPVNRKRLAMPYRDMPDDELRTKTIRIVLRPKASQLTEAVQ